MAALSRAALSRIAAAVREIRAGHWATLLAGVAILTVRTIKRRHRR